MKTEHILIMRFSALGDVAMLVPVVSSLARQYPGVRVTVLSRPFARALFEGIAPNVGFMEADLSTAIDQLLDDIQAGRKYMKVYRQMKMYNDPSTNPVLYRK